MKQIRVDFTQDNPCLDGCVLGHIGEHNATELVITPPVELAENEAVKSYIIVFVTGGKSIPSESFDKTETLTVTLWQQLTLNSVMGVQLEAYDDEGEFIGKSEYVAGLRFLASADGKSIEADTDNQSFISMVLKTKHSHENKDVLDKFGEDEDGSPIYNGKKIEGSEGIGLTEEQAADLAANTEARHKHSNKDVLDCFGINIAKTRPTFKGTGSSIESILATVEDVSSRIANMRNILESQISSIPKFSIEVVDELPTENISNTTVYLLKDTEAEGNLYTEYIYINDTWEILGSQQVDLTGYAKTEDISTEIETALAEAKASGEFDGIDGQDGADGLSAYQIWINAGNTGTEADFLASLKGSDGLDGKDGANGEKGADGVAGADGTSVTVASVSESTADGGSNVVTFSDGKTLTVKNGSKGSQGEKGDKGDTGEQGIQGVQGVQGEKGEKGDKGDTGAAGKDGTDGYTPVKGIDYWTDTDQEEIKDDCNTYIATELAKRGQLKPEFANDIDECTDITKLYVLPDGYIYAYMVNGVCPEVTYEVINGQYLWYNGGSPKLYSSTGTTTKRTNVIPVNEGDILKVYARCTAGHECNGLWFDENNQVIGNIMLTAANNSVIEAREITAPTGAKFVQLYSMNWSANSDPALEVSWVYCKSATEQQWANTGHAFIPADYEAEILDLDSRVKILEETTVESILKDKTIVYDGDSLCAAWVDTANNIDNGGGYAELIKQVVGCNYINKAVGGGVIRSEKATGGSRHSVVDTLTSLPTDADLYCFEGGVNDYSSETPIGTYSPTDYSTDYINNLDTSTFCGALEKICSYSMDNFLGKPICFIIVHKAPYCAFMENDIGLTFADYREKMIGILEKYSIPYYDAFKESGLNGLSDVHRANYFIINDGATTGDGWHPNAEGYKRYYVPQLISLFEKIMPIE